jgi:ATP-binding cassette subfamily C protein
MLGVTRLVGDHFGLESTLVVYVMLIAGAAWVVRARKLAVAKLYTGFVHRLRVRMHAALLGMEWRAFMRLEAGTATQALTMDTAEIEQGINLLLVLMAAAIEVPVLLVIAFRLSLPLTMAALALIGVAAWATRPLNRRTYAIGATMHTAWEALHGDLADDLAGMRVIRSHGLEAIRGRRFTEQTQALDTASLAYQSASATERMVVQTGAATATALVVLVSVRGFALPLAETMVLVLTFARLLTTASRMQEGARTVLRTLPAYGAAMAFLDRCQAAAEMPARISSDPAAPPLPSLAATASAIRLEGVGYHYSATGRAALTDVDLRIPGRGITAIVGPSGAGKSTLADLLLGLLSPDTGRILVDDQPLEGLARSHWRHRVGYVPQDSFLFHDTLRANLLFAAPLAGEAELWDALERAAVADVVRAQPEGLEMVVGDRGSRLSGGERQRVALARALLRRPDLLILDEATSALDAEGERRVLAALDGLRQTLSIAVIAHRPSTVRGADHVVMLEAGRVVATGSWSEIAGHAETLLTRLDMH